MRLRLKRETTKLKKSWMQYDAALLGNYLVEDTEDPRLNVQSVLTRHFLIEALFGSRFSVLQDQELRFAAVMNWLLALSRHGICPEDADGILDALEKGADNSGGIEIPHFVSRIFAALPATAGRVRVPNYIREALEEARLQTTGPGLPEQRQATFQMLWRRSLSRCRPGRISVLEPACGSANDYRFLEAFGLARLLDYEGLDLCEKNFLNARKLFPGVRFKMGNAFELDLRASAFDFVFVHDLFEHLSIEGMETAVAELCRVARHGICAHFFNMAEVDQHTVRPVDDYHWNTLSMARMRELFLRRAASVQVIHIGSFLRWRFQCPSTHNQGAYTFVVKL